MNAQDGEQFRLEKPTGEAIPISWNFSLGRSPSNSLVLTESRVSRHHAVIHAQDGREFWLADLGSSNGTFLNGRRMAVPTRIRDGDVIEIGSCRLVFREADGMVDEEEAPSTSTKTLVEIRTLSCWMLVTDIRGFSRWSRTLPPDELSCRVGTWLAHGKTLVEKHDGAINKYLGDGFFAYWHDGDSAPQTVVRVIEEFLQLQGRGGVEFRFVVHTGHVSAGGGASLGEESLLGQEVNFVFRMERLASSLGKHYLVSEAAARRLDPHRSTVALPDTYELSGFEGKFPFYVLLPSP